MSILEKVKARTIDDGGCWIWQGPVLPGSLMPFMHNPATKSPSPVRRLLMLEMYPDMNPKRLVVTQCRTPRCVNPEHLVSTTRKQVQRMTAAEGRMNGAAQITRLRAVARTLPHVKLDEKKAAEMRLSTEPTKVLSKRYGISVSAARKARTGKTWMPEETRKSPWGGLLK